MSDQEVFLFIGLGIMPIGLVLLFFTIRAYIKVKTFLKTAIRTLGTVTQVRSSRSAESGTSYSPEVMFILPNGKRIFFVTNFSSSNRKRVGDPIEVFYPPEDPEKARLKEFLWFWPMFLGIFAGVSLIIGVSFVLVGVG